MPAIINAITSGPGGVQIGGDASGNLQLQSAGNTIATISSTGLSVPAGITGIPAFFAYPPASNQSLTNNTWTKVTLSNTSWNVGSTYGYSTANSRFTATVPGYYYFAGSAYFASSTNMTSSRLALYYNGSAGFYGPFQPISTTDMITTVTGMFQLAVGEYIELYAYSNGGTSAQVAQYSSETYLQCMFLRSNVT
jgi:hypothetical protein